jgi:hypothetical protein
MSRAPLRRIKNRGLYTTASHPHGAYSIALSLECGHTKRMKSSDVSLLQVRARCEECQMDGELYDEVRAMRKEPAR